METAEKVCPVCGKKTEKAVPASIFYCDACQTPLIFTAGKEHKTCSLCGAPVRYLGKDLRPVFPEERLLLEILWGKPAQSLARASLWACGGRYYIDGRAKTISLRQLAGFDTQQIASELRRRRAETPLEETAFRAQVARFVEANAVRFAALVAEAQHFVIETAQKFPRENIVLSFSGGKDSTVTADLVTKALADPSLVHIFGDTTLEFPTTLAYARRFQAEHPYAIFQVARNDDQSFRDVASDIGPPARQMRWCCSMFKTGPITRVLNDLYPAEHVLTFYGIRRAESVSRSKYRRVESDASQVKIHKQTVAAPLIDWLDLDVWLYLLTEKIDFNAAYRLGYERVGCWLCPNNNKRDIFLSAIYWPERAAAWRDFLIGFAKRIGKPDPENYVDSGAWKARQGGNGLASAEDVKIRFTNCTAEDHAKIYRLTRPYGEELLNLFVPFGRVAPELGRKILHETLVLDAKSKVPILSLQPFAEDGWRYAVKVRTLNVADHEKLQTQAAYQIRKFNACRGCLKCESICQAGAISLRAGYHIDPALCVHCKMCVTAKYLRGGCMMEKYLRTRVEQEN